MVPCRARRLGSLRGPFASFVGVFGGFLGRGASGLRARCCVGLGGDPGGAGRNPLGTDRGGLGRTRRVLGRGMGRVLRVFGSQGALNINNGLGYAINQYRDGTHSKIPFGSSTTTLFIDDFVNAILEKRDPMVTCDDAMQTAAFLDASLASAHSGRVKSLN